MNEAEYRRGMNDLYGRPPNQCAHPPHQLSKPTTGERIPDHLTEQQIADFRAFVVWHGAIHARSCPGDSTCNCKHKAKNDAAEAVCQQLPALIAAWNERKALLARAEGR